MPSPPTPTTTTTSISPSSAACPIPPSPTVLISFCQFCCCCCCCCSLIRRRSRTEGSGGLEGSGRPPQPQLSRAFSSAANSIRVSNQRTGINGVVTPRSEAIHFPQIPPSGDGGLSPLHRPRPQLRSRPCPQLPRSLRCLR
ncbi:hypothetical protein RHMOL_Rhmol09G0250000 [Rhododendron molle]|uniref:Uncharacterized protein n=1 Tax=Rhododendron molle TaxID=49168 RepID=A0ACC0MHD0_RHOML|nr:hypothetical protein RHMOL_Rhmol09G0250000 [Rhododendron molle]